MGQKVHPTGIRLGISKPWTSTWYANTAEYADNLFNDHQVRKYLTKELKNASLSKIVIERPAKSIRVTIHTARPGVVIGKKGEKLKIIGRDARQDLERLLEEKVYLELWVKVKDGWADDERALRSLGFDDFKE